MDKTMKDALIERAARAFRSVDEPDLSEGLQLQYRLTAALEAAGVLDLVEALEKHAEQHTMMAEMARRVENGSPVYTIDRETGKNKRSKFATVVRTEAEASEKHARAALNRMKEQSND